MKSDDFGSLTSYQGFWAHWENNTGSTTINILNVFLTTIYSKFYLFCPPPASFTEQCFHKFYFGSLLRICKTKLQIGHVNSISTVQFFLGISRNTQSKSKGHYWLSVSGNSKIMHCGILIDTRYSTTITMNFIHKFAEFRCILSSPCQNIQILPDRMK